MLSVGFVLADKVMHTQAVFLLSAHKIVCMHEFGSQEFLKLSRIV